MGPKRADNASKSRRLSQTGLIPTEDQENQQCTGRFASDLELCCRELPVAYPVNIPVYIRGHPPPSSQIPPVSQQLGAHSGPSVAPSLAGGIGEEQLSCSIKRPSRGRIPSLTHSGILTGTDNDNKSNSIQGQEACKSSSSSYRTFHLVRDSEFFRPKLLVDSTGNENEPIEQINTLYMRAWQLDQRFIEILKKILPLQEQLHTLNFCFVGLNKQTIHGIAEVCPLIKNLKTVSLDGNPLVAEHFHILLEKEDIKMSQLSLRFCKIADTGAEHLANALGNMSTQNCKLLTLTLTGNQIGDNGAKSFAKALRYNRTLISLNLSSNFITDKGACALALVLRKIVLTQEEIVHRRYLLAETHLDEMRANASSPTLSTTSTKSKSGRDARSDSKRVVESSKSRKINSTKDKRHRTESGDEVRPPSASKGDLKKGKSDSTGGRAASVNPRHSSNDQARASSSVRGKKTASNVTGSSKKHISVVKEEDEDALDEFSTLQMQHIERENPLLEINDIESHNGEISLKGNLVLINLNLSRNYLTLTTVNEFLLSIEHQTKLTHFNDTGSISSAMTSLINFSGLCRLELKGMIDIPIKSPNYQSLEMLLLPKTPTARFQQVKEREAKELLEQQFQQQQQTAQVAQQIIPEKTRAKPAGQRPTSRLRD